MKPGKDLRCSIIDSAYDSARRPVVLEPDYASVSMLLHKGIDNYGLIKYHVMDFVKEMYL